MRLIDADALKEQIIEQYENKTLPYNGGVIGLIENAPTVRRDGWVSVDDRLPERCVDVLCFFINNTSSIHQKVMCINADGEWQGEDDFRPKGEKVTHWQPLPEPPKE